MVMLPDNIYYRYLLTMYFHAVINCKWKDYRQNFRGKLLNIGVHQFYCNEKEELQNFLQNTIDGPKNLFGQQQSFFLLHKPVIKQKTYQTILGTGDSNRETKNALEFILFLISHQTLQELLTRSFQKSHHPRVCVKS